MPEKLSKPKPVFEAYSNGQTINHLLYRRHRFNSDPESDFYTASSKNIGGETEYPIEDALGMHYLETRQFKVDKEKNKHYAEDIFKGQIALSQLEILTSSNDVDISQKEQIQQILKEPQAAHFLAEFKRTLSNKKIKVSMEPSRESLLETLSVNISQLRGELRTISGLGEADKKRQIQEIVESRTIIYKDAVRSFDLLVMSNTRLVGMIAFKFTNLGLELPDLIQHGYEGLIKAAARYNYLSGFQFSTYATNWINQSIHRAVDDYGNSIRVPVHAAERAKKIIYTIYDEQKSKAVSDISRKDLNLIENYFRSKNITSLNTVLNEGDTELGSLIPDPEIEAHVDIALESELEQEVSSWLKEVLTPREREVIELRYGFGQQGGKTLEQVGRKLMVTRERVRQIEVKALRKLKGSPRSEQMRPFLQSL